MILLYIFGLVHFVPPFAYNLVIVDQQAAHRNLSVQQSFSCLQHGHKYKYKQGKLQTCVTLHIFHTSYVDNFPVLCGVLQGLKCLL